MAEHRAKRMTVRVLLLVTLAFLPALFLYVFASRALRNLRLETHHQELLHAAAETQITYQGLITRSQALLASLSAFPEIRDVRQPACNERLARVLEHNPWYTTISVISLDGYMVCGSLPADGQLYLGDRLYFTWATSMNGFAVGDYHVGRITGKPGVGVALPFPPGGSEGGVVAASIDLTRLAGAPEMRELPEGASLTVLDRNGTILVRWPRSTSGADTVGAAAPDGFPSMPSGRRPAISEGRDPFGFQRIYATAPLLGGEGAPQGYVTIGTLRAPLMDEVDAFAGSQLRFLLIAGLLLAIAAWLVGHFSIVRDQAGSED